MKILICMDDTDTLEKGSTGKLTQAFIDELKKKGLGEGSYISRHQLFVHPDIPYTSHNSSMCFEININPEDYSKIIEFGKQYLIEESEIGSDPGFCVAKVKDIEKYIPELKEYGRRAKKEVLTKEIAYKKAEKWGIHLSEHGGTGDGIIGALAGVGLRLTGNDGRIKGRPYLESKDGYLTYADIIKSPEIDHIEGINGEVIKEDEKIKLSEKNKTVYKDYKRVLLLIKKQDENLGKEVWHTLVKEEYKVY